MFLEMKKIGDKMTSRFNEEDLNQIVNQNKVKKNVLRESLKLESITTNLIEKAEKNKVEISWSITAKSNNLKFIYNVFSANNEGQIKLICHGQEGQKQEFEIGGFSNSSVIYLLKTQFLVNKMDLIITSIEEFSISQLEVINISKLEYKIFKFNMYYEKMGNILKKQPHLKKKFIHSLKSDGIKMTLVKFKGKLYQNDIGQFNKVVYLTHSNFSVAKHSNKKPILFISHDAQNAGVPLLSLNIIKVLKEQFKRDVVLILLKGGPLESSFAKLAEVINLNQNSLSYLENSAQVEEILQDLKNRGIEICYANSIVSNILGEKLNEKGIKLISIIHELPTSIKTYDFIEASKNVMKYSDSVIFPNEFVKSAFIQEFPIEQERITVLPQGLFNKTNEIDKLKAKQILTKELNLPANSRIILGGGYGDLRKGIDLFFKLAFDMLNDLKQDLHFVWLGHRDPILEKWLMHDAEILGVNNRIHLLDFTSQPAYIYQAAEVFVLTSREDPLPSMVLENIDNQTPVLAFSGSGGIPEIIKEIGIEPVPYLDVRSMASSIIELLNNEVLYKQVVGSGLEVIKEKYNFKTYVRELLGFTSEQSNVYSKYKVTVVIPNYNYEKFIAERLYSIINQTVKPYEILFLDDVSKDNSVQLADSILKDSGIKYRIIENQINNGCFKQWNKGIHQMNGDIIWIAEADDVCEVTFLEELLPNFDDQEVNLSYCQSQIIDEHSNKVDFSYIEYTNDLSTTKWQESYCISGKEEVIQGLAIKNTIPNASGVLMRKSSLENISGLLNTYSICGDWFTYVYVLKQGKVAFNKNILNYHRRHSNSIISVKEQTIDIYDEIIRIKDFIIENFQIPSTIQQRFLEQVSSEYMRLGCKGFEDREIINNPILGEKFKKLTEKTEYHVRSTNYLKVQKNILLIAPDLTVGGGQMLVIRLANYLSTYQNVHVYNARGWLVDQSVVDMISLNVKLVNDIGDSTDLRKYIIDNNINAVNSHIWWSDKVAYEALKDLEDVNWTLSMHGCYENLVENPEIDNQFLLIVEDMFKRANHIIYATEKNLRVFEKLNLDYKLKLNKIYYGYELQSIPMKGKHLLNIPENEFVFGIVSRAIKEKGWEEAISAIIKLNENVSIKSNLVLIGRGEYAENLKKQYENYSYIHFITKTTEPSEWIGWVKMFDVAMLPTYFISESLPNSVIEYLAYGKPVISTNIGEIKNMIIDEKRKKKAGILLELNAKNELNDADLVQAMEKMITNKNDYDLYKTNTEFLFEQFKIENFITNYFELYKT